MTAETINRQHIQIMIHALKSYIDSNATLVKTNKEFPASGKIETPPHPNRDLFPWEPYSPREGKRSVCLPIYKNETLLCIKHGGAYYAATHRLISFESTELTLARVKNALVALSLLEKALKSAPDSSDVQADVALLAIEQGLDFDNELTLLHRKKNLDTENRTPNLSERNLFTTLKDMISPQPNAASVFEVCKDILMQNKKKLPGPHQRCFG